MAEMLRLIEKQTLARPHVRVLLQERRKAEGQSFDLTPYKWLVEQCRCRWFLMHIEMAGKVNPVVFVDWLRRFFFDNEEGWPAELNEESLRLC